MKVGFVGLSHLAINYLVASSIKGFDCIGVDEDLNLINDLKSGKVPFYEPGLHIALNKNKKRIVFSNNFKKLMQCDLVFVAKDIKTDFQGKSQLSELKKIIFKSIKNLKKKNYFYSTMSTSSRHYKID